VVAKKNIIIRIIRLKLSLEKGKLENKMKLTMKNTRKELIKKSSPSWAKKA
jgi:hypothetical protein